MTPNPRRIGLLFLGGVLIALVFLSASISNLQLHPGVPLPGGNNATVYNSAFTKEVSAYSPELSLIRGLLAILFLGLMLYVPVRLLALIDLKKILQWLSVILLLLILINVFAHVRPGAAYRYSGEAPEATLPPAGNSAATPLGEPPPIFIWLVIGALGLGTSILLFRILKMHQEPISDTDQLSHEAELAIDAIKLGEDLRGVIIRCYLQMTRVIQMERRLERNADMTVREFEDWLSSKGFPLEPVHRLTRLFERARYDQHPFVKDDEDTALDSLHQIILFCQSKKEPERDE